MEQNKRDVQNEQNFRVLLVSKKELEKATMQSKCVCDECLATPEYGYYVAVLNRWLCPRCYERWIMGATRYLEDCWVEEMNYGFYKGLLGFK